MSLKQKNTDSFLRWLVQGLARAGAEGQDLLLAVSGGGDSMALLVGAAALREKLGRLEVACIDHGLRPGAADELDTVRQAAGRLGLPFHSRRVSISRGAGLEARARDVRYAALEEIRAERGLTFVATAHTASDQAETVLMRLARGSGVGGAAGIRARRDRVVRPMLAITRDEVRAFLLLQEVGFHEDPMNRDPAFTRTRFREEVLPALVRATDEGVERRLAAFARIAEEEDALVSGLARAAHRRLTVGEGLDAVGLRALPPALQRRVVKLWLEASGERVDTEALEAIVEAVFEGRAARSGREARVWTAGGIVRRLGRDATLPAVEAQVPLGLGEAVQFGSARIRWTLQSESPTAQSLPDGTEGPLVIRTRRPGDRVVLGGGRTRKLQDVLVDARVPREDRDLIPVIADGHGRVLVVVGVFPRPGGHRTSAGVIEADPERRPGGRSGAAL